MQKSLTSKQKIMLSTIKDLRSKLGKPPTLEEIKKELGYSGISSVQRHVDALKNKGRLSNDPYQARSLEVSPEQTINIPLVGNVAAGTPILAIENIEAYVPYDSAKIKANLGDHFFLRAVGDSMNKADINGMTIESGDYVLVRKQDTANYGQIVVALIGDEATIKKLSKEDGHISLEPISSNPANKPIYIFDDSLLIQGVVVDVFKGNKI
ncbi:MAG: transcriptional repressor LexA [Candidatus Levybacteria bacterium]|nr:transcriptional repressor LexA [Candidatus Levybacteria bacterium]